MYNKPASRPFESENHFSIQLLPKQCIQTINAETTVSFDGDVDALLESIFDGEFAMATAA